MLAIDNFDDGMYKDNTDLVNENTSGKNRPVSSTYPKRMQHDKIPDDRSL
jgi:hypothetical protein